MAVTPLLTATAIAPNLAGIVLPPSTSLAQFESLQGSQDGLYAVTTAIVVAVALGILICDYFHLFSSEIKLYRTSNKALWYSPATWAFVLLRYSGILAMFPVLFFTVLQSKHCQSAVAASQAGGVLVVASSGLILYFRVITMWSGHKAIYAVVGIMYVAMVGCWCAVVSQFRAETGPPSPFGSNCQILPTVSWSPIGYAVSVAFDSVVILLAVFKLINSCASSNVGDVTYRDSLLYFVITAVTNAIVLVIQTLGPNSDLIKPTAAAIATLITAVMGARVYLNIECQIRLEQVLPFSSMTSSRSGGTYVEPIITPRSTNGTANPQGELPKAYPINFLSLDIVRPDTPFASYDYNAPKDVTHFQRPVFTRETFVTVE